MNQYTLLKIRDDLQGGFLQGAAIGINDMMRWLGIGPDEIRRARSYLGPKNPDYYCELAMVAPDDESFALCITSAALALRLQMEGHEEYERFIGLLPK